MNKTENKDFSGVTHYTRVDVQPGGINIQHVEHLHQADILDRLGIELEVKKKGAPECLCTQEANELWEIAKQEGWVDEDLQPRGLSRPDAALLAARMGKLLGIEGWVPFEQLWHRQNIRCDYNKSQYNQKTDDFEKKLKRKLQ